MPSIKFLFLKHSTPDRTAQSVFCPGYQLDDQVSILNWGWGFCYLCSNQTGSGIC